MNGLLRRLRRRIATGSTLIVAINALMLKRIKLAGIRQPGTTAAPKPDEMPAGAATALPAKARV